MLRNLFNFSILFIVSINLSFSQSDGCSFATVITPQTNCNSSTQTHGSTVGATQTIPAGSCGGTSDDDVWYQFTATSTSHTITVSPDAGMDAVVDLYSGGCSVLVHLSCADDYAGGGTETITYTGFSIGQTYRVRVYSWGSGSASQGEFDICISQGPITPPNNSCANAQLLTVNATCTYTSSTTNGATPSGVVGCAGNADDDVWFQFTATNSQQWITSESINSSLLDIVMNVYSGNCSSLSLLSCVDNTYMGGVESVHLVGLTVGQTYYIQLYDYYSNYGGDFQICVEGAPTPTPSNDEPCNAIQLPVVTSECQYMQFTNVGATTTTSAPQPFSCNGYVSDPTGGFSSYSPKDVWFKITVPSTGSITINHDPSITGAPGEISDGVMALYSGTCGSLNQIACSENYNYPGAGYDLQPMLNETGLTPGSTVYLRYWGYGTETGTFGFCVSTATNDDCSDALYICDLNGYKGSTSAAYTPDRPGTHYAGGGLPNQMYGNNETPSGVNQPNGNNTGGPFGYYPPSNIAGPYSSPSIDVNIENNSWVRFTASLPTVVLNVGISDCFVGGYPTGGIQMQIFSSNGCSDFTPVSNFEENSTGFTITANGLTVGQDYLLMIDGFAGDICNYTISANTGVQFPDIPKPSPICPGASVTLTAPPGATSYEWQHNGSTSQSVTVSPSTTTTYQCEVTGLCDHRQTLSVTVEVMPTPLLEVAEKNPSICMGESITLHASGADQYSFEGGPFTNSNTFTVSPTTATTYTIQGQLSSGCTASKDVTVNVNTLPNVNASANTSVCIGQSTTISASGATSYSWDNGLGSGSTQSVSPTSNTTYTVTGTDINGCENTDQVTVSIDPLPNVVASSDASVCNGESISISASGASSYSWDHSLGNGSVKNVSPTSNTTYTVTGTDGNGCQNTDQVVISVNPLPNVTASTTNGTICNGESASISASGALSYSWDHGLGSGSSKTVFPSSNTTYTVTGTDGNNCENTDQVSITVNELPVINASGISTTDSDCGGSTGSISGISVTSPTSGYTIQWINGSNNVVSNTLNPSGLPAGNYTLTVSKNGCSTTYGPVNISNPGAPTVSILPSNTAPICQGESVTLTATGNASSYDWGNGNTSTIITVSPSSDTTINLTGTKNGCDGTDTYTITVKPMPNVVISIGGNGEVCIGEDITLSTGGNAGSYQWGNGSTQPNITISPLSDTTVTLTGTTNGCDNTDSYTVVVNPLPTISGTPSTTPSDCGTGTGTITGLNINPSGATVLWTNSSGDPVGTTTNVSNLPADDYTITVTDGNGCSADQGPISITNPNAPNPPDISVNSNNICENGTVTFTINTPQSGVDYDWSGPNGFISTSTSFTIDSFSVADQGNYCVTLTESGCISSPSCESIVFQPLPNIEIDPNASDNMVCENGTANITATGGDTYSWTGPNSSSSTGNSIQIDPFTTAEAGYYYVVGTDNFGCTNRDSIQITALNNPTLSISSDESTGVYCNGGSANLSVTGANDYTWTAPDNSSYNGSDIIIDPLNNSNSGWYIVVGTDNNQCSATDSIQITSSSPNIEATLSGDAIICPGDPIQFNASDGDYSYNWSGPNGNITADQSFTILNAQTDDSGWYFVTITDSNNCVATDSVHVTIVVDVGCLKIPTLITPNFDDLNDNWTIPGLEAFPEASVQIYNRWGNLIFEENPFKNNWGGEVNHGATIDGGGKVPPGTYFYILDLHDKDNTPPYKGSLEVEYKNN